MIHTIDDDLLSILESPNFASANLITYCVNTLMSFGPYLIFNKSFRMSAYQLIHCKKMQIHPSGGAATSAPGTRISVPPRIDVNKC